MPTPLFYALVAAEKSMTLTEPLRVESDLFLHEKQINKHHVKMYRIFSFYF